MGKTTIGYDSDWSMIGRRAVARRNTASARSGVIPGRSVAQRGAGIDWSKHPPLCGHGQKARRCDDCGALVCLCPGTAAHVCIGPMLDQRVCERLDAPNGTPCREDDPNPCALCARRRKYVSEGWAER